MVILAVNLDNLYAFTNFNMNLTYPKKIVGSSIKEEHLEGRSNFRYKKVNIIMGSNASGKTTFGRALMKIFNFMDKKNYEVLTKIICDNTKEASFSLDIAFDSSYLYRVSCKINPLTEKDYSSNDIMVNVVKEPIRVNDSYESCINRLQNKLLNDSNEIENSQNTNSNYINELEKIPKLDWMFRYPDETEYGLSFRTDSKLFSIILEKVLKSLDISIHKIEKSKDFDDAYVVRLKNKDVLLQNGVRFNSNYLSSGTIAGIQIAEIITAIKEGRNTFFFCDEKFTYIHSDMEKAILSVMISSLKPNTQLFFTTHNTDILDLNLPKHSYTFLRKISIDDDCYIENINASSLIKKNTDSLKNAVENDLFCISPSVDDILDIADLNLEVI